tara:strand:- start:51 stop:560 length:510 start_codon:yes stop_codon:yes gene_type:complete
MAKTNKMKMVKDPKTGKMVPDFAADGKGQMAAGKMVKKKMMAGGKQVKKKSYAAGKMVKKKMMAGGKMVKKMMAGGKAKKGYSQGKTVLKDVPAGNEGKGLSMLPTKARNNMGFKAKGGAIKKMAGGKMVKKMMAKGKMVKGGATGGKKKAKVRGAGIARKGVRPAKMV